jgi:hypothetical protein
MSRLSSRSVDDMWPDPNEVVHGMNVMQIPPLRRDGPLPSCRSCPVRLMPGVDL